MSWDKPHIQINNIEEKANQEYDLASLRYLYNKIKNK